MLDGAFDAVGDRRFGVSIVKALGKRGQILADGGVHRRGARSRRLREIELLLFRQLFQSNFEQVRRMRQALIFRFRQKAYQYLPAEGL